ncbi:MAG: hypothetical protein U5L00_02725 [Desulfovermiculus sp.]|nr:hypothetical protein [Desulfovermiculus sp.]
MLQEDIHDQAYDFFSGNGGLYPAFAGTKKGLKFEISELITLL